MARKVIIEWDRGWKARYPSGRVRWWRYPNTQKRSFVDWIHSFLRQDGDSVEVRYAKTVTTYTLRQRRRK